MFRALVLSVLLEGGIGVFRLGSFSGGARGIMGEFLGDL